MFDDTADIGNHPSRVSVTGVLLAGGMGRRMGGGDKPLRDLAGKSLLSHSVARARPQVESLVLNVNGDVDRFAHYDMPVVTDVVEGYAGPLAGIHAAMEWSRRTHAESKWLVSFATDAPFFPTNMVSSFLETQVRSEAQIICARSRGRTHPVFALWSLDLVQELRSAMVDEDLRKIDQWTSRYTVGFVDFDEPAQTVDPFFNINRPEDLAEAEQLFKDRPLTRKGT